MPLPLHSFSSLHSLCGQLQSYAGSHSSLAPLTPFHSQGTFTVEIVKLWWAAQLRNGVLWKKKVEREKKERTHDVQLDSTSPPEPGTGCNQPRQQQQRSIRSSTALPTPTQHSACSHDRGHNHRESQPTSTALAHIQSNHRAHYSQRTGVM